MHRGRLAVLVERGLTSGSIQPIQNNPQSLELPQNIIQHLRCNGIIKRAGRDGPRATWKPGVKFAGFLKQLTEMEGRMQA